MSADLQPERGRKWLWPLIFVAALALVIFLSGLGTAKGPGGIPVLKSPDEYNETLNKANARFATLIGKADSGQPLTEEDRKSLRDASVMYDQLNLFNPTRMGPFFASGRIHLILGEYQLAAERFQQAIYDSMQKTDDPPKAVSQLKADSEFYLSTCLEAENDFKAAFPPIDQAVKQYPERGDYRYVRARALIQLGRISEAKNDLRTALQIDPSDKKSASLLRFLGA